MGLADLYGKYKNEILTGISIGASFLGLKLIGALTGNTTLTAALAYWPIALPWVLLVALSGLLLRCRMGFRHGRRANAPLQLLSPLPYRYKYVLDETDEIYYLLGMSAEEFQREIELKDYFAGRVAAGKPVREVRILLLHPDSDNFKKRILEVNPGCDIEALVERKKQIMKSLYYGITSLPSGTLNTAEIRFFNADPCWMIQFYRKGNNASSWPNRAVLMMHLRGRHSKHSLNYLVTCEPDAGLFEAFLRYFLHLWETALPFGADGEFPKLYSPKQEEIKLIALDFDGVVVESSAFKMQVFLESLGDLDEAERQKVISYYSSREALSRTELLIGALRLLGRDAHLPEHLAKLLRNYSQKYRTFYKKLELVRGLEKFHEVFRARYQFAIVSNAPTEEIEEILKVKGVEGWFGQVFGYPSSKVNSLKRLMKAQALEPSNVVYVGDAQEDLIVSESLGMRFIGRKHADAFHGASDIYTFQDYDELVSVMYQIEAGQYERAPPLPAANC